MHLNFSFDSSGLAIIKKNNEKLIMSKNLISKEFSLKNIVRKYGTK